MVVCAALASAIGTGSLDAASPRPFGQPVPVGEVVGTVTLPTNGAPEPPMLSPYARRRYAPPVAAAQDRESPENVVVYIVVEGSNVPVGEGEASILQRDRTIIPRTIAIRTGTRIDFPNSDQVFHNLFSLSGTRPFNLGRYAPGDTRSAKFERPGIVRMFCDIHSEMTGTIVVLDTPYFTQPDADGSYRIRDVPEGRHRLVAWHESAGTISTEIEVKGNRSTRADLRLGR
jgi:plastocyanin